MSTTLQVVMAGSLFIVGLIMIGSGLWIILAREYQDTMRTLSAQAPKLAGKTANEATVIAAIDGTSRLLDAVRQLIQTAMGVGAFLCLFGLAVCGAAFYMAHLAG